MSRLPVGELFVLGFHGPKVPHWVQEFATTYGLGGVIVFDYYVQTKKFENNIYSKDQFKNLCQEIRNLPSKPMVFIDQEGGKVRRLKETLGFAPLPPQAEWSRQHPDELRSILDRSYAEMQDLGVQFNLAPVVDLNLQENNPGMNAIGRSFGRSPKSVIEMCDILFPIANKHKIALALKHYPGLGAAKVDSHLELTDISDAINAEEMGLYQDLLPKIKSRGVLVSHGIVKQWEAKPACISSIAVENLRKIAPDALLITDDMQMAGMQKYLGSVGATIASIEAGMDLVIFGNNLLNQEMECSSYAKAVLDKSQLDGKLLRKCQEAIDRIRTLKKWWY